MLISHTIFMCWIYKRTSTIWIAVVIHFLNNNLLGLWKLTENSFTFSTPLAVICYVVIFGSFIFSKTLKNSKKASCKGIFCAIMKKQLDCAKAHSLF